MATSELDYLRRIWPRALFAFIIRYQQDLERKRKECKERFGCTQSGNCTHCGKYIQMDLGKHIAFYHLELAQLWRCPVMWCTVWKGTAQDCIDHMRRTHEVSLSVKAANLSKFILAWTVTREQWADMLMPSISGVAIDSRIGSPLCHHYQLISRTGSHEAFRGTYLRVFLDESDSAMVRRLHRWLAQELVSRVVPPTDSPASVQPQSTVGHQTVSLSRRPRRLKRVTNSAGGPESSCRLPAEMSSIQALMDLALPRFAGLVDGPRQVHPPWSVVSDSPASPASTQLEPRGEEVSRCSMDQPSMYLNLAALSSSSEEESQDLTKRSDLSVTLTCSSEETGIRVYSDEVFSDEDFPAVFGARDIRQVVRRRTSPPGSQTIGAAQDDRQQEPPAPVVDLVTGKCKPGKVSRTVSTSPLKLDLTVRCTVRGPVRGLYPGCTASGHRGRYSDCCRYEYAVRCPSGSSCGAAGYACQGVSDTSAVTVPRVASIVRTVVLVSLTHAAVGSSGGLVAALFAQPCSGGALSGCSGHQDSSFGLLKRASRLRLEGSYCQRRWSTLMIRFWVIRSHMRGVKSFRGQNPHCRCRCMRGRQVRPFCWTLQYCRLCWLRGPPHCRRRGPRPLPLLWTRGMAGY